MALGSLVACSSPSPLLQAPIVVSKKQLQDALQARQAQYLRLADWLELRIESAQVELLPETQQVQTRLALTLQESMLKSRWPVQAHVGFGTRFDAVNKQFVLTQVQLLGLESPALPTTITATAKALISQALTRQLEGQTLYALKPAEIELLERHAVVPGPVRIDTQEVRIALVPLGSRRPF